MVEPTWMLFGDFASGLVMGLVGLLMADSGGSEGMLSGLTKSTDHPSSLSMELSSSVYESHQTKTNVHQCSLPFSEGNGPKQMRASSASAELNEAIRPRQLQ